MLNPNDILAAVVAALKSTQVLVDSVGGNQDAIQAYYGSTPAQSSLARAIFQMPASNCAILAVYMGFGPKNVRSLEYWSHRLRVIVRGGGDTLHALVNGCPLTSPVKLLNYEFLPELGAMDVPSAARVSMLVSQDGSQAIDYFQFDFAVTEKGDN